MTLFTRLLPAAGIVLSTLMIITHPAVADAQTLHEDPATAEQVFSGFALFEYYSSCLDLILARDDDGLSASLARIPWANVPATLERTSTDFGEASANLTKSIAVVERRLADARLLREQMRWDESQVLTLAVAEDIKQASATIDRIEESANACGREFRVVAAPEESEIRRAYRAVHERIGRLRGMVSALTNILQAVRIQDVGSDSGSGSASGPESAPIRTLISLDVSPSEAFVGDTIFLRGTLTSPEGVLGGREVDILLDGSAYLTVRTDSAGEYRTSLDVPEWYRSTLEVKALYYPRQEQDKDHLAAVSQPVIIAVRFYETHLQLELPATAYPGLQAEVEIDLQSESGVQDSRHIEAYLDYTFAFAFETAVQQNDVRLDIPPMTSPGMHVITVTASPYRRYAPAMVSKQIEIVRAPSMMDLDWPSLLLFPGNLDLRGRAYSQVGPLQYADIRARLGDTLIDCVSGQDGAVSARAGLGFSGIMGFQDLSIDINPKEPWNAPGSVSRRVFTCNLLSTFGIASAMVFLGIYLPRRLRKRFGVRTAQDVKTESAVPSMATRHQGTTSVAAAESPPLQGPRGEILNRYRNLVSSICSWTKLSVRPGDTLREFASQAARFLGPGARPFMLLTRLVERIAYSKHEPTDQDVNAGMDLSDAVKERLK